MSSPILCCHCTNIQHRNQSLELANNVWDQNSLAAMRLNTTNKDVPSGHEVSTYIHNKFVNLVKRMKRVYG